MYGCMAGKSNERDRLYMRELYTAHSTSTQNRGKSESIHTSRRAENNNNKIHENTQISSNALGVGT